ncbi:MAG: DUF2461 domain-containing protein [Longimicrobiales bacterium]|nr:DUF2461 domain-containing protein [Longimicrobiales bacterium]
MGDHRYFTKETFRFLRDLKENNDRAWFAENKARYERELKVPALHLIEDFGPELKELSPHFKATPRSLFRIYRDVRFSKDKSPFKTAAGIHFRHDRSKDAHAPGFYLHVEPDNVFLGVGIWRPGGDALRAIRERIVEKPDAWRKVSRADDFTATFELAGDSLKRGPRDFDHDHPLIDDLKRKDFVGVQEVPESFATREDLPAALADRYRHAAPFMAFLCAALDVPY